MKKLKGRPSSQSGSGHWFVNGLVWGDKEHERVWKVYRSRLLKIIRKGMREDQRHWRAKAAIKSELQKLKEPFTPWLGHANEPVVEDYLKDALEKWKRLKEHNATTDY
jgi:hypothetical protein